MPDIRYKRIHGKLGQVVYQLSQFHFSRFQPPGGWQPALNAYRFHNRISVCVDLAGIDKQNLDLQVRDGHLILRGERRPPDPQLDREEKTMQILALEIDHGAFERRLRLPPEVDPDEITAEYKNGLLWIDLPLRPPA